MKITKITHGHGETRTVAKYHSVRIYNEIEVGLEENDKPGDVHKKLFEIVDSLNNKDFEHWKMEENNE